MSNDNNNKQLNALTLEDNNNNNSNNNDNSVLKLESIIEGENERGIPAVKFIEEIDDFANSFTPPVSAEILIGAFTNLFQRFKSYESSLSQKRLNFQDKIPEIEKSLSIVKHLKFKKDQNENLTTQYNLADNIYGKAEIDTSNEIVNLWLGANVMLEYTYDDAIDLLETKLKSAKNEFGNINNDLSYTRNQIITAEVNISRIYNWNVRKKRNEELKQNQQQKVGAGGTTTTTVESK